MTKVRSSKEHYRNLGIAPGIHKEYPASAPQPV